MYTERLSEALYPLARLNPANKTVANHDTGYVSVKNYHRVWAVIEVGVMAQGATLDALLYQATDTAGTGGKVIAGKSITQLTQAGGDGNQILCIELQTEELDVDNAFDCVQLRLTVAGGTVYAAAQLYGCSTRFAATPTTNWEEIVG